MSFLNRLKNIVGVTTRKAIAPPVNDSIHTVYVPQDDNYNSFMSGHENFNQYIDYPNLLGPLNTNVAYHNPNRVHAPFAMERRGESYVTGGGVVYFDSANPEVQAVPRSDLQIHFDERKEIPVPSAWVPSNGVEAPKQHLNYGWAQTHPLDYDVLYGVSVLSAPPPHLSRGINVLQRTLPNDTHRASMKTRAPKPKIGIE